MSKPKKVVLFLASLTVVLGFGLGLRPVPAGAVTQDPAGGSQPAGNICQKPKGWQPSQGNYKSSVPCTCPDNDPFCLGYVPPTDKKIGNECTAGQTASECIGSSKFLTDDVQPVVNVLAAMVAVVVLINIILGGIQYATSGDKPESAAGGRKRIVNSLVALLIFFLMYAFISYLIPGGVFK